MTPQRIVLVGAARSGTKIVREVLARATDGGRVPYDIGFVWRYRNESVPHDVLDPRTVTRRIRSFIAGYIDDYAGRHSIVLEKTVGNSLRLPFVHAVLPDATFVHLIRDGVDVAESSRRQWLAPVDRQYLSAKIRHFPLRLVPSYGSKYAASLIRRYVSRDSRVGTWGPRYPGIDQEVRTEDLLTVCGRQWQTSIDYARDALSRIDAPSAELRYEKLINDPESAIAALLSQLGLPVVDEQVRQAVSMIEPGHTGTGSRDLSSAELGQLDRVLGPTLSSLGYPAVASREVMHRG